MEYWYFVAWISAPVMVAFASPGRILRGKINESYPLALFFFFVSLFFFLSHCYAALSTGPDGSLRPESGAFNYFSLPSH